MTTDTESTIAKPEVYETRRIQLTSPMLHIGSAVSQLSPFEYVQTEKFVYLPNQDALARALRERGYLSDYIKRIEDRQEIVTLLEAAFGENWQSTESRDGQPIFPKERRSLKWTDQKITDLRPMIRNGFGQLYIPGSSIKGAIRTAIAYHLLKHGDRYNVPAQQRVSEIERRLRESMGDLKKRAKFADDKLFMDQLFTYFRLDGDRSDAKQGPNTDFMRAVHISDTEPLLEKEVINKKGQKGVLNQAVAVEVIVSSHFPDWKAKSRASIYTEMVRLVQTTFAFSLDTEMLSWFRHTQGMQLPFQTIDELIKLCQEFAQDQWDFEHDYWQSIQNNPNTQGKNLDFTEIQTFYEPEQCPFHLRIGWASGMTGTTINMLLKDDLTSEIRDICGIKAPGFEAPKSRRTVVSSSGSIKFTPGWIKFKAL